MNIAEQVGAHLLEVDKALFEYLGFTLVSIAPGTATVRMDVQAHMTNGAGFCQGGLVFTLADQAFAYACMSTNQAGLTLSADIVYNNPAHVGDTLTAIGTVLVEKGRIVTCDAVVRNQDGLELAHFRGLNYRLKRALVGENS